MTAARSDNSFDKAEAVRKTKLFDGLSPEAVESIANRAYSRHLTAGQVLFSEHEQASVLYIVIRGRVRSIRQSTGGREQVLSWEEAGAVLALAPVFNGGLFYSTMIADTDADVLCITRNDMRAFCQEHSQVFWSVTKFFSHKIRHLAELVEMLALRNVDQRVAQYLLSTCQERGVSKENSCVVDLPVTQTELASRVGSTREVVCRALGRLEEDGLIQMTGSRHLTVPDLSALRRFAGVHQPLEQARHVSELSSDVA